MTAKKILVEGIKTCGEYLHGIRVPADYNGVANWNLSLEIIFVYGSLNKLKCRVTQCEK